MNWEALAAFAEMAGAIAVVASLLFVGSQLRQAQSIERAKAQRDLLIQAREFMSLLAEDEARFESVRTCLADFDRGTDFDKERFNAWAFNLLFTFEQVYYMHQDGYVNQGSFDRFEQAILSVMHTRGGRRWWELAYRIVGTDVGDYLSARSVELGDAVPPYDALLPYLRVTAPGDGTERAPG